MTKNITFKFFFGPCYDGFTVKIWYEWKDLVESFPMHIFEVWLIYGDFKNFYEKYCIFLVFLAGDWLQY